MRQIPRGTSDKPSLHDVKKTRGFIPEDEREFDIPRDHTEQNRPSPLDPGVRRNNLGAQLSGLPNPSALARRLVEPDGIEPTTSCLQSRRSPN